MLDLFAAFDTIEDAFLFTCLHEMYIIHDKCLSRLALIFLESILKELYLIQYARAKFCYISGISM